MYDSENIPLNTRIEAGTGVAVTYSTNSDGEGVFRASIDSDYLVNLITANAGGTLTLSTGDEARLAAVEAKLGLNQAPAPTPTPEPTGTTNTTEIDVLVNGSSTGVTNSTTTVTFTYSLVAADGTVLLTENSTVSGGSSPNIFELTLQSQFVRNPSVTKRVTPIYSDGRLVLQWNTEQLGSTVKVDIVSKHADDVIVFNITDY